MIANSKSDYETIAQTDNSQIKPAKIEGTNDYAYKGCVFGQYKSAQGGVRWMVIKDGHEVKADLFKLWSAVDYVDQH